MTKINKAGKSTLLIAILSFLLVAVLTFGGTYAYFSASTEADPAKGEINMGALYVYLTDGSDVLSGDTALQTLTPISLPGQQILNEEYTVSIKETDESTINALVRVKVEAALDGVAYTDNRADDKDITATNIFKITAGGYWYQHTDGYAYYVNNSADKENAVLKELTPTSATATLPISIVVNNQVGKGGSTYFMGKTGTFSITVEAIQADYIDSGDTTGAEATYKVKDIAGIWAHIVNNTNDYAPAQPGQGQ